MSIFVHWWQFWFEGYPAAPSPLMAGIIKVLTEESPEIVSHFD
jgi:hypothetical protein